MHSLFVKLASLAVMFHMTFGCAWHHGLGKAHTCANDEVKSECEIGIAAPQAACCHDDQHDQLPAGELAGSFVNSNPLHDHDHGHSGCEDDSCPVTRDGKSVVSPDKFVVEYLGGVEKDSLVDASIFSASVFDPFPDRSHTGTKVRAHLLFGVQTL